MSARSNINKFRKIVKANTRDVWVGTLLDMFGRIVKRTPVGQPSLWQSKPPKGYRGGTLRQSWQVGVNLINTEDPSGNQGADIKKSNPGDTVFITNNQPHALPVEHGWSTQIRPGGMVKVTVNEFKNIVRVQSLKVRKK